MCLAVQFEFEEKNYTPYFPNPYSTLPVLMKNTEVQLMPWGRRQSQAGNLPLGGWARLDSIKKRLWQKYFAMPIKIPVLKFAEKDIEGKTHWFPLASGQFIQGLHATYDDEVRFYIVTIALEDKNTIHDRWPRILVQPE